MSCQRGGRMPWSPSPHPTTRDSGLGIHSYKLHYRGEGASSSQVGCLYFRSELAAPPSACLTAGGGGRDHWGGCLTVCHG